MKKNSIIAMCMETPAYVGLFIFAGWKIALCIVFIMWADNIDKHWKI